MKVVSFALLLILATSSLVGQTGANRGAVSQTNETYELKNGKMDLTRRNYYEYDKKGNVTMDITFTDANNIKTKETYTYNKKGNEIEHSIYDSSNVLISKITTTYDRFQSKQMVIVYNGTSIVEKTTFEYDAFGRKITERTVDAEGKQIKRYTYKYDKRGNLTERALYDSNDTLVSIKSYNYTYNSK